MIPHANATRKVLSHIDHHHYKHDTTTAARLHCMQNLCGHRKGLKVARTRIRLHDFNSLYRAMERSEKKPEDQDTRVWTESEWPMEKLSVAGSRTFAAEFLEGVIYSDSMADVADSDDAVLVGGSKQMRLGRRKIVCGSNSLEHLRKAIPSKRAKIPRKEEDSDPCTAAVSLDAQASREDVEAAQGHDGVLDIRKTSASKLYY